MNGPNMIFLIYNIIISTFIFIFFVNYFVNFLYFKDISNYKLPKGLLNNTPLISILIPARNEEENIRKCLMSLINQDYSNTEILVLDDNSSDKTSKIVKGISKVNKKVKLINGRPLPAGWTGKNYACYQLFNKSKGEYLFFTDADTIHNKRSVSSALGCLLKNNLDIISASPKQIVKSFHERMVIGFINFTILIPPLLIVEKSKIPIFGSGVGSLMLFKRSVYSRLGGHKKVRESCVEDTRISKLFIKMGYKFMIFNGVKTYSTRLNHDLSEIYNSFCRVFLGNFNNNRIVVSIIVLVLSVFFLFPFILLLFFLFLIPGDSVLFYTNLGILIFQVFLILLARIMSKVRLNGRILDVLLHPVSILYIIIMDLKLIFQKKDQTKIRWKGRSYSNPAV